MKVWGRERWCGVTVWTRASRCGVTVWCEVWTMSDQGETVWCDDVDEGKTVCGDADETARCGCVVD